ncbi:anthranilate synthase component I [Herbiconiux solani]|uniref:anthranilate synthase component I n=1 Tax=Herbiconiux solani TaxID=661329 RepID=UPI00082629C1|nr:anthranilate synthase component I [Herbiconiux solani]
MTATTPSSTSTASTTRAEFDAVVGSHRVIPVVRELFADGETPVGIYRKLADGKPGTFLLESAEQGGIWSRFSFIGVSSFGLLTESGDRAAWIDLGLPRERAFPEGMPEGPLDAVSALYDRWKTPAVAGHPPLTGGLVGFVGWESVRQLERLPNRPPADYAIPSQGLAFAHEIVVVDHAYGTVQLIVNVLADERAHASAELWADAQERLDQLQTRLAEPSEAWLGTADFGIQATPRARTEQDDYLAAVEVAKEHIREGDIFQVVVAQRFELDCPADPLDVYRVLRMLNPSPYMYLLTLADTEGVPFQIVGSSPEALVKIGKGHAHTHPIAGSKPRGATPQLDLELEQELLGDQKEKAEHLMLVDLARNDLLKVCEASSVEVTEFMRVERFSHIMHIVSSVEGRMRDGVDAVDVFRATFPAGTLSGAPKPRALEIIDALEPAQRGVYGGVVGYFAFGGDADLAIAIRTATIREGVATVQAGGGVVADSDPVSEFQESQNKAAAPLRAVAVANAMTRVR